MRHLIGLALAGAIWLGSASRSDAQFAISIGTPYAAQGYYGGQGVYGNSMYPGSVGLGVPGYATGYRPYYSPGYVAAPTAFAYSSGYRGYVAPVNPYGFQNRPYYGAYGYGGYGYGSRDGFRPFQNFGRRFR